MGRLLEALLNSRGRLLEALVNSRGTIGGLLEAL